LAEVSAGESREIDINNLQVVSAAAIYTLCVCVSPNKYHTTHKHQQIKLWDFAAAATPLSFNSFSDVSEHVSDTKKLNTPTL
jgi:hypothetical protein